MSQFIVNILKFMIAPEYLSKGSKIAIVATARKISENEISDAVHYLRDMGFVPVYDERLFETCRQFAGNDVHRAAVLQEYLDDDEIDAILCARGGYGTVRIIDNVDFGAFANKPKWIIGYSDVTVLHTKIQSLGYQSIHATMPVNFKENTSLSWQSMMQILTGDNLCYEVGNNELNKKGYVEGELVGGNLSVLYSLLGSDIFPDTDGKILFIEDLDEYLYHIDRMMMALRRAGKFKGLAGLVVGGLTRMHDNDVPFGMTVEEIVAEKMKNIDIPVCFGMPFGHLDDNRALVLGAKYSLSVDDEHSLLCRIC